MKKTALLTKSICRKLNTLSWSPKRTRSNLSYIHHIGKEPLKPLTIGKLLELTATKNPNKIAIISRHQDKKISYGEILKQADKLAAGFRALGLEKGDRLGLWAPNMIEWFVTGVASARSGLIMVAINPMYQAAEIEFCIKKVGIKALVCPDVVKNVRFYDLLNEVIPELPENEPGKLHGARIPSLKNVIVISDKTYRGTYNYEEVMDFADDKTVKSITKNQDLISPDDPFVIQFTSGTTGLPKAATGSHFQIVNNAYHIGKRNELNIKEHKICVQVPFFHAFGITIGMGSMLNFAPTAILPSPFYNPVDNLEAISKEDCSIIYGTPTMYVDLVNVQREKQLQINPEIAVSGGAPCSPKLFKQMQEVLKVKRVKSVYGLTEATAVAFQSLPVDEDEYKSTSTVGHVGEHLEVKIVDADDNIVPIGTPGELCIRGYSTMLGYWGDEEQTSRTIGSDKWLKTGDQFVLQEDGYGRIVGRLKEVIIRGGENIFPKEIEDLLNGHPDVLETHVIGLYHERLGEEVCACIRLKPGSSITHDDLVKFCKGRIAKFKIPSLLKVVDEFPKTVSGKIQKYLLKKQFEQSQISQIQ